MVKALKNIVIAALSIFISNAAFSQVKFEKVYGSTGYDYGYSVTQMYDVGYAVAGSTTSFGSGSTDVYLLKTDSMGVAVAHRTFGGINIDQAYSVKTTSDSGLVIAGYTNSFGAGGYDMYVIKTDKNCNLLWEKTYGGTNWDFAYSIEQTLDGGYIIAGGTYSFGNGSEDMYLVKINSLGDTLWTKTYGGINDEEIKSIKQTSDNGYIFTGYSKSFGDVNGDIYTVKTDGNGDTLWTYKYSGAMEDYSYDVLEDNTGAGYIIAGETKLSAANFQGIIIRVGLSGIIVTSATYGGTANDGTYAITQTTDGRFATMGYTTSYGAGLSDFVLYKEKPIGTYVGSSTFGGGNNDKGYCIKNTKDGGYIICGTALSYSTLEHIYLIKTDSLGISTAVVLNVTTGINDVVKSASKEFTVYPNPANIRVTIRSASDAISSGSIFLINVTDLLGRTQISFSTNDISEPVSIDTELLKTGVYFITIISENYYSTQKLIIQKQ